MHTDQVSTVAWSPDGKRLASAGYDQTIKISDPGSGKVIQTLIGHAARINSVAWNPGGTRLVSASEDRTVKVWDTGTGKETLTLGGHRNQVNAVAWSPKGQVIVSAGNDRTIMIHDASLGYFAARSPGYLPNLDRRLEADPKNQADWRVRAEIHAGLQEWDKAAQDLHRYLCWIGTKNGSPSIAGSLGLFRTT